MAISGLVCLFCFVLIDGIWGSKLRFPCLGAGQSYPLSHRYGLLNFILQAVWGLQKHKTQSDLLSHQRLFSVTSSLLYCWRLFHLLTQAALSTPSHCMGICCLIHSPGLQEQEVPCATLAVSYGRILLP